MAGGEKYHAVIGIVIVTHGRLAEELYLALEHVVGPQPAIARVCVGADDDLDRRRQEITDKLSAVDQGQGVIVLTDMFGGTPSNLAVSVMQSFNCEVISGVNLPMLVKLAKIRSTKPLQEASEYAQVAGRKYIAAASQCLAGCRRMASG